MIGSRKKRNTKKTKIQKKKVLIALEDTKSARFYFDKLVKDKGLRGDVAFAPHRGTDPENVVRTILIECDEKKKSVSYESKWAVIDIDSYQRGQVNGAIQRARSLDICVAVSNECYELWILLHFTAINAHMRRREISRRLNTFFLENYRKEYDKSLEDVYEYVIGRQNQALINAKLLMRRHIEDKGCILPFDENPLTTIYQLVSYLNKLQDSAQGETCEEFFPGNSTSCPLCSS